jgi:DNA polymerase III alpha subunit (gram-positive type)
MSNRVHRRIKPDHSHNPDVMKKIDETGKVAFKVDDKTTVFVYPEKLTEGYKEELRMRYGVAYKLGEKFKIDETIMRPHK